MSKTIGFKLDIEGSAGSVSKLVQVEKTLHDITTELTKLKKEGKLDTNIKEFEKLRAEQIKLQQEGTKLRKEIREQNKEFQAAKYPKDSLIGLRMEYRNLAKQIEALDAQTLKSTHGQNLVKQAAAIDAQVKKTEYSIGNFRRNVGNYQDAFRGVGSMVGGQLGIGGIGIGGGLNPWMIAAGGAIKLIADISKVSREYGAELSNLGAISGATESDLAKLDNQAKFLGATTAYTATQVLGLQTELAKLGFTVNEILSSTGGINKLSVALKADAGRSAALAGAALRSFNMDASEMDRVVSALAISTTKSALDFSKLETAVPIVSAVANSFNFELEDTVALLGALSNAGFDASMAATATRNIFLNLADANGALAKRIGGSVSNFDELINAFIKLREQGVDLGEALELTDVRSVAAFSTFLNGAESVKTLRDSITDVKGDLDILAEKQLKNVSGQAKLTRSAYEGLILAIDDGDGIISSITKNTLKFFEMVTTGARKLIETTEVQVDVFKEEQKEANRLFNAISVLDSKMNDLEESSEEYNRVSKAKNEILGDINAKYGEYLPSLLTEKSTIEDITEAQSILNNELLKKQLIITYQEEIGKAMDLELKSQRALVEIEKQRAKGFNQLEGASQGMIDKQSKQHQLLINQSEEFNKAGIEIAKESQKEINETYDTMFSNMGTSLEAMMGKLDNIGIGTKKVTKDVLNEGNKLLKGSLAFLEKEVQIAEAALKNVNLKDTDMVSKLQSDIDSAKKALEDARNSLRDASDIALELDLEGIEKSKNAQIVAAIQSGKTREEIIKDLARIEDEAAVRTLERKIASAEKGSKELEALEVQLEKKKFEINNKAVQDKENSLQKKIRQEIEEVQKTLADDLTVLTQIYSDQFEDINLRLDNASSPEERKKIFEEKKDLEVKFNQDIKRLTIQSKLEINKLELQYEEEGSLKQKQLLLEKAELELALTRSTEEAKDILRQKNHEKEKERIEELKELARQAVLDGIDFASDAASQIADIREAQVEYEKNKALEALTTETERRIEAAEGNSDLIKRIKEEEDAQREQIEREAFERTKRIAKAEAKIQAGIAVIRAFATSGPIAALFQIPFIFGQLALQLAAINSQKFAEGGKVKRIDPNQIPNGIKKLSSGRINEAPNYPATSEGDNVLALVRPGEVILNETQQSRIGGATALAAAGVPGFSRGGIVDTMHRTKFAKQFNTGGAITAFNSNPNIVPDAFIDRSLPPSSSLGISDDQMNKLANTLADILSVRLGDAVMAGSESGTRRGTFEGLNEDKRLKERENSSRQNAQL